MKKFSHSNSKSNNKNINQYQSKSIKQHKTIQTPRKEGMGNSQVYSTLQYHSSPNEYDYDNQGINIIDEENKTQTQTISLNNYNCQLKE